LVERDVFRETTAATRKESKKKRNRFVVAGVVPDGAAALA